MSDERCRRQLFRLKYPKRMRPTLVIEARPYNVTELSEGGLKFEMGRAILFPTSIEAVLHLDDEILDVSGELRTFRANEAIVINLEGVSFKRMMEEQRRVLSIFPIIS